MKKILFFTFSSFLICSLCSISFIIILTAFLIFNCFVFLVSASENSFYVSDAVIITPENPSITDKYAAERLKYYIDKITGENIQIDLGKEDDENTEREGLFSF